MRFQQHADSQDWQVNQSNEAQAPGVRGLIAAASNLSIFLSLSKCPLQEDVLLTIKCVAVKCFKPRFLVSHNGDFNLNYHFLHILFLYVYLQLGSLLIKNTFSINLSPSKPKITFLLEYLFYFAFQQHVLISVGIKTLKRMVTLIMLILVPFHPQSVPSLCRTFCKTCLRWRSTFFS